MTVTISVDVGITGAACALRSDEMGGIELMDLISLPSEPIGTKRRIHVEVFGNWLEKIEPDFAVIENVHTMPGEGSASSFRFGGSCEAIRASVALYRIKYRMVAPQTWKRWAGFPKGSEKDASREVAMRMLPACSPFLTRKKSHNMADAVIIALWGVNQ